MERQNTDQKTGRQDAASGMKKFVDEANFTVSDRINEVKDELSETLARGKNELVKMAKTDFKKMEKVGQQIADYSSTAMNFVKDFARKKPITALAIVAAVSAVVVSLATRSANRSRN